MSGDENPTQEPARLANELEKLRQRERLMKSAAQLASIGIALYPDNGVNANELVRAADSAMCRMRHQRKNGYGFAVVPQSQGSSS